MAQIARPDSDVSVGTWSPFPADPITLFDKLNEVTPNDDTDYIVSSADEDEFEIGLTDVNDPEIGTGHIIRCYAKSPAGAGGGEQITISLIENGNVRCEDGPHTVNRTAYGLVEYTLSEAEANAITNYANLRFRVHINKTDADEPIRITQAEFECPDAAEAHSGTASISGNGSVVGMAKKGALGSAVKSAGGAVVALGLAGMLGIASIAGGGTQVVIAKKAVPGTASVSGNGAQAVVGKKSVPGTLAISGGGSLVATGTKAEGEAHSGTASISGNGTLAGVATKQASGDSPITGGGAVVGSVVKQALGASPITGGGSIVATGEAVEYHFGTASVSGNGALVGIGTKQAKVDVSISANGALSGAGEKQSLGDLAVTGGGSIVATGEKSEAGEHSGVAIISGGGTLAVLGTKLAEGSVAISGGGSIVAGEEEEELPRPPSEICEISGELKCLENYEKKKNFTHAQLAADMTAYGWQWTESRIIAMLAGKVVISTGQQEFIRRYLLTRYSKETLKED